MEKPRFGPRFAPFLLLIAALLAPIGLACSSGDDDDAVSTPTTQETAAFCTNVERTAVYLGQMRDALVPLDQVALVEARQNAAASIELLNTPATRLQGGSDALDTLKQDLNELNRLFATQDLSANADAIRSQAAVVENDLQDMKDLGNCPGS
jgi:hypothetical protein